MKALFYFCLVISHLTHFCWSPPSPPSDGEPRTVTSKIHALIRHWVQLFCYFQKCMPPVLVFQARYTMSTDVEMIDKKSKQPFSSSIWHFEYSFLCFKETKFIKLYRSTNTRWVMLSTPRLLVFIFDDLFREPDLDWVGLGFCVNY